VAAKSGFSIGCFSVTLGSKPREMLAKDRSINAVERCATSDDACDRSPSFTWNIVEKKKVMDLQQQPLIDDE
jgi:hypothetical protein